MMRYPTTKLALGTLAAAVVAGVPIANSFASGPPAAATAFATAVITPQGGSVSGFGITATFAPGAVTENKLAILGNWPNGLDVPPPSGQAVKTFGLQVCNDATGTPTGCTSEFGNYPNSPSGTERIDGTTLPFLAGGQQGVNFGTATHKLVSISVATGGNNVYVYNPNVASTAGAYPKLLPSTSGDGVLTFTTFQPIVWTVTSPTS